MVDFGLCCNGGRISVVAAEELIEFHSLEMDQLQPILFMMYQY